MRLLVVTQSVDEKDPVLGFFIPWIEELAKEFEHVEVICLKEGIHKLPANTHIHSLGKEYGPPSFPRRIRYAIRFLKLVWKLRGNYDAAFIHMNQEYILVAGFLWLLLKKPIYFWYNHFSGSWRTDLAAMFCTKIFCTSKYSYTARYKKTLLMPVGVDTRRFFLNINSNKQRKSRSILFLGRMAPSKHPEVLIEALAFLTRDGVSFSASFVGSPASQDQSFYDQLKAQVNALQLSESISFFSGVPNSEVVDLYRSHEIFVNCSPSGMLDKTIFEAAACGCFILAASKDFAGFPGAYPYFTSSTELAIQLERVLQKTHPPTLNSVIELNSLSCLIIKLSEVINSPR